MAFPISRPGKSPKSDVLPTTYSPKRPRGSSYGLTRRLLRWLAALATVLALAAFFVLSHQAPPPPDLSIPEDRLPPLYEEFRRRELNLPHYDAYEKNSSIKYFWAAQHAHSSGWGNVMQDYLMMALLAHATGRSFVFDDYIWNKNGTIYADLDGRVVPARTPLSALLGGPMVGGSMLPGDDTPRSVNKHFFERVCPNPTVVHVSDVNTYDMRFSEVMPVTDVFNTWVDTINAIDDPCVMLDPTGNQVFDNWVFGKKHRMLPFWPTISRSPVLASWDWSTLVLAAYKRNRHLFERFPHPSSRFVPILDNLGLSGSDAPTSDIKGLMAIHVRRGDFEGHCRHLAEWDADWHAWNSFPEFIDKLEKPRNATSDQILKMYIQRCYPDIQQIVDRVRHVRQESRPKHDLNYLYVMTNGPDSWVEELKSALAKDAEEHRQPKWKSVKSSQDLELTWEETFVSQGIDMYIAQRAEVIIGNGWSSLTSNSVLLRMVHGFPTDSMRFW
ncbi:hypothetical protein EDC04DRAFT_2581965 [Pisolithus marmoratus]|nr:hypothetical protein EDC04DRAFT_2581965 [Pisolithus marmoratus]